MCRVIMLSDYLLFFYKNIFQEILIGGWKILPSVVNSVFFCYSYAHRYYNKLTLALQSFWNINRVLYDARLIDTRRGLRGEGRNDCNEFRLGVVYEVIALNRNPQSGKL